MKIFGIKEVAKELKIRTDAYYGVDIPLSVYIFLCRKAIWYIRRVVREDRGRIFLQNCHIRQIYKDFDVEGAKLEAYDLDETKMP